MEKRPITVEELFDFALRNDGHEFKTIARYRRFKLQAAPDRIRLVLPSNTYFTVKRDYARRYVDCYNKVPPEDAGQTTPYPARWRERSYMVRILQAARLELERGKEQTVTVRSAAAESGPMYASRRDWTRDELLIALNLYHKLTFGQMHARQPAIIAVAGRLGRTADSVAMKLCNLASLDKALQMRGIKGLSGASKLDRSIWTEFHENLAEVVPASEQAFQTLFGAEKGPGVEVTPKEGIRPRKAPSGPTEKHANVKVRCGQDYFRDAVLNNFGGCCGVTGLAVRELLIASHILPWGKYETERLNVRNGICLSRLHDAAFDIGLITFDANLRLLLSKALKSHLPQRTVAECFVAYENEPLHLPKDAVLPDEKFLAVHRAGPFQQWS